MINEKLVFYKDERLYREELKFIYFMLLKKKSIYVALASTVSAHVIHQRALSLSSFITREEAMISL